MTLRFFADHCVPASVIRALRDASHEVLILKEHMSKDSDDRAVMTRAGELAAILISLNGDFADIVSYPPSRYGGIISLQIKNHPETIPALIQRLLEYLLDYPETRNYSGRLLIVEPYRIRLRD